MAINHLHSSSDVRHRHIWHSKVIASIFLLFLSLEENNVQSSCFFSLEEDFGQYLHQVFFSLEEDYSQYLLLFLGLEENYIKSSCLISSWYFLV
jgi:hypothetical protein